MFASRRSVFARLNNCRARLGCALKHAHSARVAPIAGTTCQNAGYVAGKLKYTCADEHVMLRESRSLLIRSPSERAHAAESCIGVSQRARAGKSAWPKNMLITSQASTVAARHRRAPQSPNENLGRYAREEIRGGQ